jgi:CRP-like cAMP-binding protein
MFPIPGLERWSKPVVFTRDEVLVRQGDHPGLVRLLTSGVAKVTAIVEECGGGVRSPLLALRTSGSVLGGVPALLGGPHIASVTAITPCEARVLPVDAFRRTIVRGGDPEVAEWLARQQARAIGEQIQRGIALATRTSRTTSSGSSFNLFKASHHRQPDGSLALTFPLTVTDISHAMGATRSPVSTLASSFGPASLSRAGPL